MPETAAKTPIIIKKYANRRLYDTHSSSYITLEHLSVMTREGKEFKVVDAKSGEDITHSVLTQIIMEEENRGSTMLPVNFLRQLITMYGDQMQAMVPHYLEASMEAFARNQEQFRKAVAGAMGGAVNPFEALARQNMAMMKAAADMWMRGGRVEPEVVPVAADAKAEELAALKAQMAALQAQLEKLTKG
ncbi:polyhydroxyalkanoate synthesis repressor PhaR [Sandaracinobacteroides saxicola]|uniref:Polyhydroxyalkanoate synthesis repressor PhaR n=1 Tax=Sandaracinobacteroides saxicola TaxID=2759707 RepID=A0A7G5IDM6_9SPHN|nr:polyhydroxyalkanoate synthesis repressor PhaR [Sandaracinobacteroides saxicola]QMW21468.1 polyhydroxyalkanoate synthesis repressor PhaR [Sandaracinobacteroides saxicola]